MDPSNCNVSEAPQSQGGPEQVFHTVPLHEESFGGLRRSGSVVVPTRHQRDSDYELESAARGRSRAIDNQYMFLWTGLVDAFDKSTLKMVSGFLWKHECIFLFQGGAEGKGETPSDQIQVYSEMYSFY